MGSIYLIILTLLLAFQSSAEVVTKTVKFIGGDRFNILTKFAIGEENTGRFEIKGRFVTPFDNSENKRKLDVLFYEDSNLKLALQSDDWFKRKHFNNTYSEIMITGDGKWSQSLGIEISPKTETHVWFVTVVDWEGIMHLTNRFMPSLEFEITMLNRNSHFSHEDRFTFIIYSVLLIMHVLLFSKIILNYLINKETKESIFINSKRMIMIGLIADFWWISLTLIHLYIFKSNGEGVFILTVLSRLCYAISQITTVWTLLMIAYWWRISFKKDRW